MLTTRPTFLRAVWTHTEKLGLRSFSTPAKAAEEGALNPITEVREKMTKYNRHMVWGQASELGPNVPAPLLPKDHKELAFLDPADKGSRTKMDGTPRQVVIRQINASAKQAPLNVEKIWMINFNEDGVTTEKWTSSIMGWVANANPYQCAPPLQFDNAAEAVYFAKKRGWNYFVEKPILRFARDDDCQYQDNFLPQNIALKMQAEGTRCDQWKRQRSGASHYFRPLKYHGNGTVQQHGPNGNAPIAPHVDSCFKLR